MADKKTIHEIFIEKPHPRWDEINNKIKELSGTTNLKSEYVYVEDFSGATDNEKLQAAIDFAFTNNNKIVMCEAKTYNISATIQIKTSVELKGMKGTRFLLTNNVRGFELHSGACLTNCQIFVDVTGYNSELIYLDGKYKYENNSIKTQLKDLVLWNWSGEASGTAMSLYSGGDTHHIQYLNIERIHIFSFAKGIHLKASDPKVGMAWVNANRFNKITLSACVEMIVIDSNNGIPFECSGNSFTDLQIQPSNDTIKILSISGVGNIFQGVCWDLQEIQHSDPVVEYKSESSENKINLMFMSVDRIINNGDSSNGDVLTNGFISRGTIQTFDWNSLTNNGAYRISETNGFSATYNQPVNAYSYGLLNVFSDGLVVSQVYIPHHNEGMYIRSKYGTKDWTSWSKIGGTVQIESRTNDPVSPTIGQMWLRSDL